MKPAMYIVINKGLGMSPGKIGAQAGHAAVEATLLSHPATAPFGAGHERVQALWDAWRAGGHYVKYVMEARDRDHLLDIERYLNNRGFRTALIIDEGRTEITPITPTALGCALVDKDDPHTAATFSSLRLYKVDHAPKAVLIESTRRITPAQLELVRSLADQGDFEGAKDAVRSFSTEPSFRPWYARLGDWLLGNRLRA